MYPHVSASVFSEHSAGANTSLSRLADLEREILLSAAVSSSRIHDSWTLGQDAPLEEFMIIVCIHQRNQFKIWFDDDGSIRTMMIESSQDLLAPY